MDKIKYVEKMNLLGLKTDSSKSDVYFWIL